MKRKKKMESLEAWSHKHDFPIEDVWNTDNTIARLIVPDSRRTEHWISMAVQEILTQ